MYGIERRNLNRISLQIGSGTISGFGALRMVGSCPCITIAASSCITSLLPAQSFQTQLL